MHGKARKCTEITEIKEKHGNIRKGTEKNGKARKGTEITEITEVGEPSLH